jgi:hypothetical protein
LAYTAGIIADPKMVSLREQKASDDVFSRSHLPDRQSVNGLKSKTMNIGASFKQEDVPTKELEEYKNELLRMKSVLKAMEREHKNLKELCTKSIDELNKTEENINTEIQAIQKKLDAYPPSVEKDKLPEMERLNALRVEKLQIGTEREGIKNKFFVYRLIETVYDLYNQTKNKDAQVRALYDMYNSLLAKLPEADQSQFAIQAKDKTTRSAFGVDSKSSNRTPVALHKNYDENPDPDKANKAILQLIADMHQRGPLLERHLDEKTKASILAVRGEQVARRPSVAPPVVPDQKTMESRVAAAQAATTPPPAPKAPAVPPVAPPRDLLPKGSSKGRDRVFAVPDVVANPRVVHRSPIQAGARQGGVSPPEQKGWVDAEKALAEQTARQNEEKQGRIASPGGQSKEAEQTPQKPTPTKMSPG